MCTKLDIYVLYEERDRRGRDRMVFGFTTTYVCNQCLSPLNVWGVLDIALCDKVWQWLATGRLFSPSIPVSSTNKIDRHDITEILLKVEWNIIALTIPPGNRTLGVVGIYCIGIQSKYHAIGITEDLISRRGSLRKKVIF
jgi:hypothetical protein